VHEIMQRGGQEFFSSISSRVLPDRTVR
jgi:hypothetical protein